MSVGNVVTNGNPHCRLCGEEHLLHLSCQVRRRDCELGLADAQAHDHLGIQLRRPGLDGDRASMATLFELHLAGWKAADSVAVSNRTQARRECVDQSIWLSD